MLRFASLGSGSKGNATVISFADTHLLLDCGFSMREAVKRLERLGLQPEQLAAVLVTHEHSDHVKGVPALARKYRMPIFMTPGTYHSREYGQIPQLKLIESYQNFVVNEITVQPVAVPHDAREPAQYWFQAGGKKLGILTDLGCLTSHVIDAFKGCDGLIIEANHDRNLLAFGPYPPSLKERVAGPWGHLSNEQAADLLEQIDTSKLQHLVVGHISQKNNTLELAKRSLAGIQKPLGQIYYACQDQGFHWLQLV